MCDNSQAFLEYKIRHTDMSFSKTKFRFQNNKNQHKIFSATNPIISINSLKTNLKITLPMNTTKLLQNNNFFFFLKELENKRIPTSLFPLLTFNFFYPNFNFFFSPIVPNYHIYKSQNQLCSKSQNDGK